MSGASFCHRVLLSDMLAIVAIERESFSRCDLGAVPWIDAHEIVEGEGIGVSDVLVSDKGHPMLSIRSGNVHDRRLARLDLFVCLTKKRLTRSEVSEAGIAAAPSRPCATCASVVGMVVCHALGDRISVCASESSAADGVPGGLLRADCRQQRWVAREKLFGGFFCGQRCLGRLGLFSDRVEDLFRGQSSVVAACCQSERLLRQAYVDQ